MAEDTQAGVTQTSVRKRTQPKAQSKADASTQPVHQEPVEADALAGIRDRLDELQSINEELLKDRENWKQEREALLAKVNSIDTGGSTAVQETLALQQRIAVLEGAIQPGNTMPARPRGETVHVQPGDLLINDLSRRTMDESGRVILEGGWRKCDEDTEPTRNAPLVAVSKSEFYYDSEGCAPYHSVKFQAYRRWTKQQGVIQVGPRELKPKKTALEQNPVPSFLAH